MISDTSGGDREAFVSACLFSFLIHGYWIHSSPGQSVHGHKSDRCGGQSVHGHKSDRCGGDGLISIFSS